MDPTIHINTLKHFIQYLSYHFQHTHKNMNAHMCAHTHTHILTKACMHAFTNACMHAYTHTHIIKNKNK